MKKLFIADNDEWAQSYYRGKLPARHCHVPDLQIILGKGVDLDAMDGLLLHRIIQPHWMSVFDMMAHKISIEFDDDMWHLPTWNPSHNAYGPVELDTFDHTLQRCKSIIVSTEALKAVTEEHLGKAMDNIKVCPNLIDMDDWNLPIREKAPDEPLTILWAGSAHHQGDLNEIVKPVRALLDEYGDKIRMLFFGAMPYDMVTWMPIIGSNLAAMHPDINYSNLGYIKPTDLKFYPAALMDIAADIAIMPLCDEPFNDSKSNIKVLECSLAGAACVATDLPPYQNLPGPRVATGDENGWYNILKKLIDDTELRNEIAATQRQATVTDWTWDNVEKRATWEEALRNMV